MTRSLVSEPFLASRGAPDRRSEAAAATATVLLALGSALVVGALGVALGRPELVVVAVAIPPTLLQDMLRYLAFRRGTPAVAALLDGGWVLGSVLAWPVVVRTESASLAVACWGAGALLGMLVASPAVRPRFTSARSALKWWRRDARVLARSLLLDSILVAVSTQAVVFTIASAAGNSALGSLRAGQVYFAPFGLVMTAVGLLVVPQLAQRPTRLTVQLAWRLSAACALLAGAAVAAIVITEPVLRDVLYAGAIIVEHDLLIPLALQVVLTAASLGFVIMAKVRQRGDLIVRSRLTSAVVGLLILVPATVTAGVQGAAWALVLQTAIYTGQLCWHTVRNLAPESRVDVSRSAGETL